MKLTTPSLVAACVLAQQAAATYNWGSAKSFSNPANTNNECTQDQKAGFDWSDLPAGGFDSYKGFDFSGFDCSNSDGKRSVNTRTGSQGKFIQGKVNKNAQAAPKISCSTSNGFSITDMEVSTSEDTDIDFVYDMPDGSTCRHTESCSKDGSTVKNSQCGGAVSVSLQKPEHASDDDCEVGIHSVGFDCRPASTPTSSYATAESSIPASSSETTSAPSTSEVASSASNGESSTTIVAPTASDNLSITYSSTVESPTAPPTIPIDTSAPMTTSTVWSTFTSTTFGCSSDVPDCPASSIKIVTMTTAAYTTICPVTSEASSAAETSAPAPETSAPVQETSAPVPETSAPAQGTSQPATETKTAPAESIPTSVLPGSTPAPSSPVPGSSYPVSESSTDISASSVSSAATAKTSASTAATSDIVTTEILYTTTTLCPVTLTSTSGSSTIITTTMTMTETVVTSTVTVCTKCTEAPPTTLTPAPVTTSAPPATSPVPDTTVTESTSAAVPTSVLPGSVSSAAPVPPNAPCPEVLPSCLNTWLSLVPDCSSNSDASCYCPSKEFTNAVVDCVQAWGASADEMSAALSYFTGICAASIPENPAIITAVPTTITLCPIASATPAEAATTLPATAQGQTAVQPSGVTSMVTSISSAPTQTPQMPVTVISYTQTVTLAAGGSSVMTSAVTVPQVSFITNTAVPATPLAGQSTGVSPQATNSVGLVPAPIITPIPTPSGAYNGTTKTGPTSSVVLFTGAAVRFNTNGVGVGVAAFAGVLAFLA